MDLSRVAALMAEAEAAQPSIANVPDPVHVGAADGLLNVDITPLDADLMREVFGAQHQVGNLWRCPATRTQIMQLGRLFAGRLVVDPEARAISDGLERWAQAQRELAALGEDADLFESDSRRWYQVQGAIYARQAGSCLIADMPGLGKTLQAIDFMRMSGGRFHLVATTNSTKFNWQLEISRWWPMAEALVLVGDLKRRRRIIEIATHAALDHPVVLVVGHAQLGLHSRIQPLPGRKVSKAQGALKELNGLDLATFVFDEAHKLRGYTTLARNAALALGPQTDRRLAMTATPWVRSDDDVWAIMSWVAPEEWGTRERYRSGYCLVDESWGGQENLGVDNMLRPEFDAMLAPRYIRRTKDVLPELPPKLDMEYRIIELSSKERKAYDSMVDDFMIVEEHGNVLEAAHQAVADARCTQIACGLPVIDEDGNVVSLSRTSAKLEAILDILESAPGEPLVVYAQSRLFVEMVHEALTEKGYRCGLITGKQSDRLRQATVLAFQDGELDVVLGTMGAGAEGITLHRASTIVLAQLDYLHAVNEQTTDRVHRMGQTETVRPIALIAQGTIDVTRAMADLERLDGFQGFAQDEGQLNACYRGSYDLVAAIQESRRG